MALWTTLPVIAFPTIDPVIVQIGPLAIRWYALAYIAGLLLGWRYLRALASRAGSPVSTMAADDYLLWATLGVVLGGRLGYVIFYRPGYYFANPLEALQIWRGGMAFHGGLLGVALATWWFARQRAIKLLALTDLVAMAAPIGLCLGRIANFINGELWGRASNVPWAMVFPSELAGSLPRHPSQLYQAGLEGVVLFVALWALDREYRAAKKPGFMTGAFLAGYAVARIVGELFREPDSHLGFFIGGTTMGQWLSLPLLLVGLLLLWRTRTR